MKQNQFLEVYSKFLQKFLDPRQPLKIVFDCSNGAAGLILKKFTTNNSKLKIYFINENPDGRFPGHGPDPLKKEKWKAFRDLRFAVRKYKADLGAVFDADADRVFFVDNLTRPVEPDIAARLLIWRLRPQKIVIDVRAGWLLRKFRISNFEFRFFESKVGHSFIERKMVAEQADFGAEHSGHYYFKKFFYLDSGILAAIEVINAVSRLPYKFSDFVDLLPPYYRREIDFPLNQLRYKTQAGLLKKLGRLRMEFPDWWFNLHFSETEPLLRLDVEAVEKFQLQKQILKLKKILL